MDRPHEMVLRLSARQEDWLIARMALSGLGMLAGLDADLIGDLQTAVNECCDCLLHQTITPETLVLSARAEKGRLQFRFSAAEQFYKDFSEMFINLLKALRKNVFHFFSQIRNQ